jgi:hypothetical protein
LRRFGGGRYLGDIYEDVRAAPSPRPPVQIFPVAGIVSVNTTGRNQNGVIACEFIRSMPVMKRGESAIETKANY